MSQFAHVNGASEVQAELLAYPAKVEARVVRASLRVGAVVMRQAVKAEAPVRSGALASTIKVKTKKKGRTLIAGVRVGDRKKGVFYGHMVMGGTRPHTITVKQAKGLNLGGGAARKSVQHPGARANNFVERSRAAIPRALDAIITKARSLVDKLNREVGSK